MDVSWFSGINAIIKKEFLNILTMNRFALKRVVTVVAALLLFFTLAARAETKKAEEFSLPAFGGGTHRLSDYRGKVVLLNFWATWCKACVEELPSLERLRKAMAGKDFVILSVSGDGSEKELGKFLLKTPLSFPVLMDPEKQVSFDLYAVVGLPTTYLIDRKGNIAKNYYGPRDWTSSEAVAEIKELMEK
jgi:peroxiredoxin